MGRNLQTSTKQKIILNREIGAGGEGRVWTIVGRPDLVAKIYKPKKLTPDKQLKLSSMVANPPEDKMRSINHISITWPLDLLFDNGKFVGYLMPKVKQSLELFNIYNPKIRSKYYSDFNWKYLIRTAKNIAIAFETLHASNYAIGDVRERNILVTDTALVSLLDTDSFQIQDSKGQTFRCPVGTQEYSPPELQGKNLMRTDRKPEHDCFGLGVLIFRLLMEGCHPFAGILLQNKPISRVDLYCMREGYFPYKKNKFIKPPKNAPSFKILHPEVQRLFLRCFVDGHKNPQARPSAEEWIKTLDIVENSLVQCKQYIDHFYSTHHNTCPWCERKKKQYKVASGRQSPLTPAPHRTKPPQRSRVIGHPLPTTHTTQPLRLPKTRDNWLQAVLPPSSIGTLGGLGFSQLILWISRLPENKIGNYTGFLTGAIIIVLVIIITKVGLSSSVFIGKGVGCLVMILGSIMAWIVGALVASTAPLFWNSYNIRTGWLYTVIGSVGLTLGMTWGIYKFLKQLHHLRKAALSSAVLLFMPLSLFYFTGAYGLPFEKTSTAPSVVPPTSTPHTVEINISTPTEEVRTIEPPSVTDFSGAYIKAITPALASGKGSMVTIEVPGKNIHGEYRATVNGKNHECLILEEYPNRLYCIGPELPSNSLAVIKNYAFEGDGGLFEVEFVVP